MKSKKINWRFLYLLYVLIYLPWFFFLEKTIQMDHPDIHILNTAIDNAIPFCEYFIIPYYLWFFYVAGACVLLFIVADNQTFSRFALSLIIGMSVSLFICMIYPSGLTLRPDTVPDSICGKMVAAIYASDTPTNVFPSIHVYNSLAVHIGFLKCSFTRKRKWLINSSLILCISICLSTVFVKQHSILDVIGACVLMLILYYLIYVVDYKKLFKKAN